MNDELYGTGTSNFVLDRSSGWANCFNCGKEVWVSLPFIGCIYCADCVSYSIVDIAYPNDAREEDHEPK